MRDWLINFFTRGICSAIAIYFINAALANWNIFLGVGVNPASVLTSGILGFPGLILLYGIGIYKLL